VEEGTMANESSRAGDNPVVAGVAPGLAGVYGRILIEVAQRPVARLIIEGVHVELIFDAQGPWEACLVCSTVDDFRRLLQGELNPFIASMRGWVRIRGDRNLGTRVLLGLQVGSPFATAAATITASAEEI
jgi:hypothetical protein